MKNGSCRFYTSAEKRKCLFSSNSGEACGGSAQAESWAAQSTRNIRVLREGFFPTAGHALGRNRRSRPVIRGAQWALGPLANRASWHFPDGAAGVSHSKVGCELLLTTSLIRSYCEDEILKLGNFYARCSIWTSPHLPIKYSATSRRWQWIGFSSLQSRQPPSRISRDVLSSIRRDFMRSRNSRSYTDQSPPRFL